MTMNNKTNIIFLDIDGVLTIHPKYNFDDPILKRLKYLIEQTDSKIVLSSSWRMSNLTKTLDQIVGSKRGKHIKNEYMRFFVDNIIDQTPRIAHSIRGTEIQAYIDNHKDSIQNYVIIDDERDMLESQLDNFVQTDYKNGLTDDIVSKCTKILKT